MVKRSRRRPLTAESRVQFPLAVPHKQICYLIITNIPPNIAPTCHNFNNLIEYIINGECRDLRMAGNGYFGNVLIRF